MVRTGCTKYRTMIDARISRRLATERAVEVGRVAETAARQQRVTRNHSAALPAQSCIEPLGIAARRVEHQQRFPALAREALRLPQERGPQPSSPSAAVYQHFRNISAVRLIFRLTENQLYGPDHALGILR